MPHAGASDVSNHNQMTYDKRKGQVTLWDTAASPKPGYLPLANPATHCLGLKTGASITMSYVPYLTN